MGNLLAAGFLRLWKSRSFWAAMSVMAGVGVFEAVYCWHVGRQYGERIALDMRYMVFALLSGIVLSAFCSLFVGTEYSDGGLRGKLAAGHTRSAIYLSNLILCIVAGLLMCLGYIAAFLAAGVPLLGFFQTGPSTVLACTLGAFLMTAALAAVFTMLSMLNQNKAVVAVSAIFLAYFLQFLGIFLNNRLSGPVEGARRAVYQFFFTLPGCQAVQLAMMETSWTLPVCSCAVLLVCTGTGLALFQKKDIR